MSSLKCQKNKETLNVDTNCPLTHHILRDILQITDHIAQDVEQPRRKTNKIPKEVVPFMGFYGIYKIIYRINRIGLKGENT